MRGAVGWRLQHELQCTDADQACFMNLMRAPFKSVVTKSRVCAMARASCELSILNLISSPIDAMQCWLAHVAGLHTSSCDACRTL
jgi:hypothetical protein